MEMYNNQTQGSLNEYPIYHSMPKLLMFFIGFLILLGGLVYVLCTKDHTTGVQVLLWAFVALLGYAAFKTFRDISIISTPVLSLTPQGITFRNGEMIPWHEMESNIFHVNYTNGIPTSRAIVIKQTGKKKKQIQATMLKIKSKKYVELCDTYAATSRIM